MATAKSQSDRRPAPESAPGAARASAGVDVLAVAAHPDDAEITCGGTLAKQVALGRRVGVLDLTRGERGTRGTPALRAREARAAARILGLAVRLNLGLPDTEVEPTRAARLAVARVLRRLRPRVVILPFAEQRHPDHAAATRLVYDACFLAGLRRLRIGGTPHRPFKLLYSIFGQPDPPTLVVDVGAHYAQKLAAVGCYASQFGSPPGPAEAYGPSQRVYDWIETVGRAHGLLIGARYGEGFRQKEPLAVADLTQLPVASI
ncbi:MAG: bacillithiol biosynthesis deacetylase BshB1 [Planctomycetes bacterium]|nr:bacillithiol biosynthesis deacetylase BshB1 [Planctomycetota bacterium]